MGVPSLQANSVSGVWGNVFRVLFPVFCQKLAFLFWGKCVFCKMKKDIGWFPCSLTVSPFDQDVEWAVVIVGVIFMDSFMSNDAMTMPKIAVSIKELFLNKIKHFVVFDEFIEFFIIHLEAKSDEVLVD